MRRASDEANKLGGDYAARIASKRRFLRISKQINTILSAHVCDSAC
jgi:hypothetical protein